MYESEGLIQLEDCIVSDGEQIRSSKPFRDRFTIVQKFSDHIFFNDPRFQLNWQIKIADVEALVNVRNAIANIHGGVLCLMPDSPENRLLKVVPRVEQAPIITSGPRDFTCFPVEGKPDVYDIQGSDGINLGRAAVQTLSISQSLQNKRSTGEIMRVMAEWSDEFESYVIISVI
jgi:hypothetical protein